jgi:DNA-directed DNA polymerase III PolC
MPVPLHVKSEFSAGYGTASVEALVRRAARLGYSALALTDVENLYGHVRLHHAARAHGIKAITGVELRGAFGPGALGAKAGRLVLLARDRAGYESLCRIVTRRRVGIVPETKDPLQCLDAEPHGVFFLSDDASVVERLLRAGVPSEDIRFLLVRPGGVGPPHGVRAVADPDVVMADRSDRDLHVLRMAIRRRQRVPDVTEGEPAERSMRSIVELCAIYHHAPEALAESLRVAEACTLDLAESRPALPSIALAPGETADARLAQICRERLERRRREGRGRGAEYEERLRHELAVIGRRGLAGYFLIVGEIAGHAITTGIAVMGRGSAVGSLVAHLLGISAVDPLRHGLYFERFLHAERKDFPDIDLDVPSHRREELLAWVFRRFGEERVAMVAAHQTFRRRAAFREGLKALGMTPLDVEQFSRRLPADEVEDEAPFPLHLLPERYRAAVPLIERLIGMFQHVSVHPGGVVMAEPRIECHAPLERAPKGVLVTQFDMESVARLGLIKIDLLGNRALSAIQEACDSLGRVPAMPDADPATLAMLREARTVGCFQIETPAMRAVLRRLPLRGIVDLAAALAIVRPGPASGEAKAAFVRRASGEEPPEPPHARLAAPLRETHGLMLYEEDIMTAISAMTGWSLEAADEMRAAIVRGQDDAAALAGLERAFTTAAESTGVTESEAATVWRALARFAAYSFNKAHATSYAQLAWQTAYLKTHHPGELASAVLNSYGGHYPLRTVAAAFARDGITLLPPHVNVAGLRCTTEDGAVRVGLTSLKRVTARSRALILATRPFRDLRDLLERAPLPYREMEALVLSGACDGLAPLAPEGYPFSHRAILDRLRAAPTARGLEGFVAPEARGPRVETYRELVRVRDELTYLGMHLSNHPMRVLREEAARAGCVSTADLASRAGRFVRVAAVVAATRRLATRGGHIMQFVTLEDECGLVEALLFPAAYTSLEDPVTNPGPFLVSGRLEAHHGDFQLLVSDVKPFHARPRPYGKVAFGPGRRQLERPSP